MTEHPSIYRYTVPIDDQWHLIDAGTPLKVAESEDHRHLEFWAFYFPYQQTPAYEYLVVGTGHPLPEGIGTTAYVGTPERTNLGLVWHLLRRAV